MSLAEWDKTHVWHPFTQHTEWARREPIVIQSGRGVWLKDTKGRRFIDGVSSLWVNVFGHRRPELDAAIRRQLGRHAHSTFLGLTHEPAIRLARELTRIAPEGLTRVFYSDNGSTAVEVALKMAYQYFQIKNQKAKRKFVSLKEGYHGDTLGSVSVGGIDLFHSRFRDLLFQGWQVEAPPHPPSGHLLPQGEKEVPSPLSGRGSSGARGEGNIAQVLSRHHREIAAVVMEPLVQGASGMRLIQRGYLKHVETLCRRYGVLLIVDEVATGFGRTGTMFAVEQENVRPDFLCVAKGLTGGYLPLAATLTREEIYRAFLGRFDEFKHFFHGHTYTANPLACAAALANLKLFRTTRLLNNVQARSRQLAEGLKPLANHPHVKEIRQIGLMVGIELVKHKQVTLIRPSATFSLQGEGHALGPLPVGRGVGVRVTEPYPATLRMGLKVCDAAFKRGVWLRPLGDVVVLMPPLIIDEKEMDFMIKAVRGAIDSVLGPSSVPLRFASGPPSPYREKVRR